MGVLGRKRVIRVGGLALSLSMALFAVSVYI